MSRYFALDILNLRIFLDISRSYFARVGAGRDGRAEGRLTDLEAERGDRDDETDGRLEDEVDDEVERLRDEPETNGRLGNDAADEVDDGTRPIDRDGANDVGVDIDVRPPERGGGASTITVFF